MIVVELNNDFKLNIYWYKLSIFLILFVYSFLVLFFISVYLKLRRNLVLKYDIYYLYLNLEIVLEV